MFEPPSVPHRRVCTESFMNDSIAKSGLEGSAAPPIVGVGASAGGLEALRLLLTELPSDTGMAYVVIQHMDPEHASMLAELLAAHVQVPVVEVVDGMRATANRIHVIPPGAELSIQDGVLSVASRQRTRGLHLPIDTFFRSLANDQPGRAIGVVLSGTGSDGTDGLRAIKAAGGITFAQDPDSAEFRGMPASAIAAGVVDVRANPSELGRELARFGHEPYLLRADELEAGPEAHPEGGRVPEQDEAALAAVLAAVHGHAGIDFRGYKRATIMRRIARRMALRRVGSMAAYAESLRDDPSEAKALGQDILIHVTAFFRDPKAFELLAQEVFPALVRRKADEETIRIWVPGCSTGEEAYSLAIGLCECLDREQRRVSVKLFATDLSDQAIEIARSGIYSEAELRGVPPERLARFFEPVDGRYRICKRVRELCVFVVHDLVHQPPFARLDLVSCRNVLIYFDAELQRRVMPMLHHCLNEPGYLFLGGSETAGGFADLFVPLDADGRVFLKKGQGRRHTYPIPLSRDAEPQRPTSVALRTRQPLRDAQRLADQWLLARWAPPGVLIDGRLEVARFYGRTGAFLEPPPGQPQGSMLRMARHGLAAHLHEAIEAAKAQSVAIQRRGLRMVDGEQSRKLDLEVVPLSEVEGDEPYFLVVFQEQPVHESGSTRPAPRVPPDDAAALAAELSLTQDYVRTLLGKHHDTTQELAAANEEMVSANEELQSINEELESAKEELQATNEELTTVNDELRHRNQELDLAANDLVNVLDSVEIPVIIVDEQLRVRRFTPLVRELASLLPADIGRPIDDVKLRLDVDDLTARVRGVIAADEPREWEVQRRDGRWLRLQVRPYRTNDGRREGAILSFVDVDVLKRALQDAESARDVSRDIVETVPIALVVLDAGLRVLSGNSAFFQGLGGDPAAVEGKALFELAGGAWDVPALRGALERSLGVGTRFRELELRLELPGMGTKVLSITGSPLQAGEKGAAMLLAIEDITTRRELDALERGARLEAEQGNLAKDLFLATLSHELRTPLGTILMAAQLLQAVKTEDPRIQHASLAIQRAVATQAGLIDDLLDISRIVSGKLVLDVRTIDLVAIAQSAVDVAHAAAEAKGVALTLAVRGPVGAIRGDATRLQQIVTNLVDNAIKFTPRGGKVVVELGLLDGRVQLVVKDTGIGIPPAALPHVFDRFVQAESSSIRVHGGLGLGLAIVRYLVDVHGGEVRAESLGKGQGAAFRVLLPLASEADAQPAAAAPAPLSTSIAGVRVLMIEDDEGTRDTFAMMLGELGAQVTTAPSAAAGLELVEPLQPHVILCDVAMPDEDGYAFIRQLRARGRERGGATPAAALTALAGEEDRKRALEAGFQMHLAKPIDADQLAAAVGALARWPK